MSFKVSSITTQFNRKANKTFGEKAAIPKAIYVIEALPLTAVGKVFKPALKRQATVMAVNE